MTQQFDDHSLLVRLDTKLDLLSASFGEIKMAVQQKAENERVDKLESRLETTEKRVYMMLGGLAVVEFAFKALGR